MTVFIIIIGLDRLFFVVSGCSWAIKRERTCVPLCVIIYWTFVSTLSYKPLVEISPN